MMDFLSRLEFAWGEAIGFTLMCLLMGLWLWVKDREDQRRKRR